LRTPIEVADALVGVYERRGDRRYDEVVTQTDHGLQTAASAIAADADRSLVVAAFLHDIGHLLLDTPDEVGSTDHHHEDVGSRFLANWFDARACEPIRLHVAAKRYLCTTEPGYLDALSPASVASLELQGGAMSAAEVHSFESQPSHHDACRLRRWDDAAKVIGAPSPTLADMRRRIIELL
jgi:phosphonate degradation associated HDIG domain protein